MILNDAINSLIIMAAIIGAAAVIGLVSFIIYKRMNPKLKEDEKTEKDYAREELDRILQPIEDEETANAVNEYKEEDD